MIRKIYSILSLLLLGGYLLSFQSCNYLNIDQYITDMQSLDSIFQKKETTEQFLYHVYSYLPNQSTSWEKEGGSPWVLCSDEAFETTESEANVFSNNLFNSSNESFASWKKYYEGIRTASTFLNRVSECKELTSIELKEYTGEAQFLKAYFYFELMKMYGPVCLIPDNGFTLDQPMDEVLISRNTWDECSDYVVDLLNKSAQNLPRERSSSFFGKPTVGAAYAVQSRLLLYSASKLFNGNTSYADFVDYKTHLPYINQTYDESKWAKAAVAALKVIQNPNYILHTVKKGNTTPELPVNVTSDPDFYNAYPDGANGIDHYLSYANMFNGDTPGSKNKEIILAMPGVNISTDCGPLKMRGYSRYNIPQKLVDAYYMVNGKTIQEGAGDPIYPYRTDALDTDKKFSGYFLKSGVYGWYLNREMRFYATVGFTNSYYEGTSTTYSDLKNFKAEFFKNGNCSYSVAGDFIAGDNGHSYCMTGYLCRKFQHPEDCYWASRGKVKEKVWTEYRLAEIYLNYVEALNELSSDYTIDGIAVSHDANEIKKYFNRIRYRAGLPGISITDAGNKEYMRELIQRERQIELAWEGHRYFDTRRWKIANEEENGPIVGLAVNKAEDDNYYQKVEIKAVNYAYKNFTQRKNFWPIPLNETTKNTNLVQNPGWE